MGGFKPVQKPKNASLLILHSDDLSPLALERSLYALRSTSGQVTSASFSLPAYDMHLGHMV